jgi:hypothetical protein
VTPLLVILQAGTVPPPLLPVPPPPLPTPLSPPQIDDPVAFFMFWWRLFSHPTVAALLAALVTGFLTYRATLRGVIAQQEINHRREQEQRGEDTRNLAVALKAEISALRDRHSSIVGPTLKQYRIEQPVPRWQVAEAYFTVFDSNAHRIGLFQPDDARRFVEVYVAAKGYLDSLRRFAQSGLTEQSRQTGMSKDQWSYLADWNAWLSSEGDDLQPLMDDVLARLDRYASLSA